MYNEEQSDNAKAGQGDTVLIDKLEDELIDHPDTSTRLEMHDNSIDETFQKKLNARADQIASANGSEYSQNEALHENEDSYGRGFKEERRSYGQNYEFLITKYHLAYEYREFGPLDKELSEWFTHRDLEMINLDSLGKKHSSETKIIREGYDAFKNKYGTDFRIDNGDMLDLLLYFSLGEYQLCGNKKEQLHKIKTNNLFLLDRGFFCQLLRTLRLVIFDRFSDKANPLSDLSLLWRNNYFKILTMIYFILCIYLETQTASTDLRKMLAEDDLMTDIMTCLLNWRWRPQPSYKVKNLLLIFYKLVLIELGDNSDLNETKQFMKELHGYNTKVGLEEGKQKCNPLDYFTFKEDIRDKFPLSVVKKDIADKLSGISLESPEAEKDNIESQYEFFMALNAHSDSLSNCIENPRPNKTHYLQSQLPSQTLHIATPVPSPPQRPSDYLSGGEKIKKLYQLNQSMPFVYPVNSDFATPKAVEEADKIMKDSLYVDYKERQLWQERSKFMAQERGFTDEYNKSNNVTSNDAVKWKNILEQFPSKRKQIQSLQRVEDFYRKNLSRFPSLIQIFIEAIKANKFEFDLNIAECELNPKSSYFSNNDGSDKKLENEVHHVIMQELEVVKVKEITLKAVSGIVLKLLQWFKTSHALKFNFLASIVFELDFFNFFVDYFSNAFQSPTTKQDLGPHKKDSLSVYDGVINQNQLMNPEIVLPTFEFFNNCLKDFPQAHQYVFINKLVINQLPVTIDQRKHNNITIRNFNDNFCFILSNLLNITDKIIVKLSTRRAFSFVEFKPTELMKLVLNNYSNQSFDRPIIKILKKIIPYTGKKWKSVNMDLISVVYLNSSLSLKDNWLSGKDLEYDFANAFTQELALKALLQFYNMRNYREEMAKLGYEIT